MKKLLTLFCLCSLVGLSACGDEPTNENNGNNQQNNQKNNTQNNQTKDESSFKVESKKDGMTDAKVEGKVDNDKASKENSGASITGTVLTLYLVAPNGTTIQAVVETSDAAQAPGQFTVTAPPDGTFVTWLAPVNGQILNSTGGTIELTSCPKAVGDQVTGQFKNVILKSEFDDSERTVTGEFDMVVYAKAGDLKCKPVDNTNNQTKNNSSNNSNNANMCTDYEVCDASMGSCCPYAQCMTTCQLRCFQTDPACNDPFSPDPVKCAQCFNGCLDECNVSQACRTDYTALASCEEKAQCDRFGDEDAYDTCVKGSCCEEAKKAF